MGSTIRPDRGRRMVRKSLTRQQKTRRAFLTSIGAGAAMVGAALMGYVPILRQWAERLRPPGALEERDFLASCIKCGQCVQVCPVEAIKLADIDEGFGVGTPYLDARAQACDFSCDAVQCVLSCPTGALTHEIDKKEQVRMGLAVLTRPDACLARQAKGFEGPARKSPYEGLHRYVKVDRWNPIRVADHLYDLELCDLCVRECPIKDAISLEPMGKGAPAGAKTPVVHEACVGCGMCEMICPIEPACIIVEPRKMWGAA